jgi:hypothetical protein
MLNMRILLNVCLKIERLLFGGLRALANPPDIAQLKCLHNPHAPFTVSFNLYFSPNLKLIQSHSFNFLTNVLK